MVLLITPLVTTNISLYDLTIGFHMYQLERKQPGHYLWALGTQ